MNLTKTIEEIEKEIIITKVKYNNEIKRLTDILENARILNDTCERCKGTGKVTENVKAYAGKNNSLVYSDSYYIKCDVCNGTGKNK